MNRRRYSVLVKAPVWGLYDSDGTLIATVRAEDIGEAIMLFAQAQLEGAHVKRL